MRKLLNNPWIVGALALGAATAIGWDYLGRAPAPAVDQTGGEAFNEATVTAEADDSARPGLAAALKAVRVRDAARDPFALPSQAPRDDDPEAKRLVEVVERLRLSACWIQGAEVLLVLNGRICQPGDSIDRFTVESAALDGAWIRHAGERSFLAVGQELAVKSFVPAVTALPK